MTTLEDVDKLQIENKRLTIRALVIEDKDIVSFFNDYADDATAAEEKLIDALKIGVVAIKTVGITEKIDYIQKEFNELDTRFKETFSSVSESLQTALDDALGEDGKFSSIIAEHFGEDGKIVKELFNPHKEGTPLYSLRAELKRELDDMKMTLGISQEVEKVKEKTTLKGYDFEDYCERILSRIAKIHGDTLEKTSDKPGQVSYSKKGDFLMTLAEDESKKIVFEMKDGDKFSLNKIHELLDESIKNRQASYGILVLKSVKSVPESVGWFNEYNGRHLVCALSNGESDNEELHEEILYIAYKYAKAKLLTEAFKEKKIDIEYLNEKASNIQSKLSDLKTILTQCSNIQKSTDAIRDTSKKIEKEVNEELGDLLSVISKEKD